MFEVVVFAFIILLCLGVISWVLFHADIHVASKPVPKLSYFEELESLGVEIVEHPDVPEGWWIQKSVINEGWDDYGHYAENSVAYILMIDGIRPSTFIMKNGVHRSFLEPREFTWHESILTGCNSDAEAVAEAIKQVDRFNTFASFDTVAIVLSKD